MDKSEVIHERDDAWGLLGDLLDWIQEEELVEDFEEWIRSTGREPYPDVPTREGVIDG